MSGSRMTTGVFPWLTLSMIAVACLLMAWPAGRDYALYERSAIIDGEWWRCYTGNFAHFSISHLLWNGVVLLIVGIWLEHLRPSQARWFMPIAPLVIGLALFLFEPHLEIYAGLSGVITGVATLLGLQLLWRAPVDRWWGVALLLLILLKLSVEWISEEPIFSDLSDTIRVALLSHIAGVAFALIFFGITFRSRNRVKEATSAKSSTVG